MLELTRKYLPFAEKMLLIENTVNSCVELKDGIYVVDRMLQELFFNINLVNTYSNYTFGTDTTISPDVEYDKLYQSGEIDQVINGIEKEYDILLEFLYNAIENKLEQNSVEFVINRLGDKLLLKLNDFIKTLSPKNVNKILDKLAKTNPELANTVKEVFKTAK